jgi:uncharacterized protein YkwD
MIKTFPFVLALSLLLASCITFAPETQVPVEPSFVTSTLPPTRSLVTRATFTPSSDTDGTTTPTLAVTVPADCKVVAVLIEDVTIPDGTQLAAGKSFTKTWKFKNTGTCPWSGYTLAFVSGDRMAAPDSAPVQQTLPGDFVNISVNLVAPSADGTYTGFFELRNADGEVVPIGLEKTFWVKIVVGAGGIPPATGSTPSAGATPGSGDVTVGTGECRDTGSPSYVSELLSLINEARAAAGVPALSLDSRLAAAAQAHSVDMACNNMISHTGSNGSTIGQRIVAAGYSPSWYVEIIAIGGPQDAMTQWKASPDHWNAVLSRYATEVGIGWADSPNSVYGGHIAVDLASP